MDKKIEKTAQIEDLAITQNITFEYRDVVLKQFAKQIKAKILAKSIASNLKFNQIS